MPVLGVAAPQASFEFGHIALVGQGKRQLQGIPLITDIGIGHAPQTRSVAPPLVADDGAPCKLETTLRGQMPECSTQHVGNQNTGIQDDAFGQSVTYRCRSLKTLTLKNENE